MQLELRQCLERDGRGLLTLMPDLAIPIDGTLAIPPMAAFWLALGTVHGERPRREVGQDGMDCNDHAYDAVQALVKEGRTPYYLNVRDEDGDPHMIAAYAARDGALYARDSRYDGGNTDVPLANLVQRGYKLLSAANAQAQYWYPFPQSQQQASAQ